MKELEDAAKITEKDLGTKVGNLEAAAKDADKLKAKIRELEGATKNAVVKIKELELAAEGEANLQAKIRELEDGKAAHEAKGKEAASKEASLEIMIKELENKLEEAAKLTPSLATPVEEREGSITAKRPRLEEPNALNAEWRKMADERVAPMYNLTR
jgi:vacuolar-type H+-ATPase subunit I/STV1